MGFTVSIPEALAYGEDEPLPSGGKPQPDVLVAVANMLRGRVGSVAKRLGWSESTLQKKISGRETHVFSVRDLQLVQHLLGDVSPTMMLAAAQGYVCVRVNPVEVSSLSEGMARVLQCLGDLAAAAHEANADGRGVSTNARNRIEQCRSELLGAVNAYGDCAVRQMAQPPGGA
ncbi:phage regulatory CII family protein [Acidovorax sp. A1169]|uniref:phage regulatory CII family protein n=1 Tax=Acidovorax sp. A1169 TaxID=3059524 RepID=UPI002737833D|nr:phage regulatory CII family protein [Acidovorax sp. A1169]MDP4074214.1 hypothetical protein [Acidovorax sp. A1169]